MRNQQNNTTQNNTTQNNTTQNITTQNNTTQNNTTNDLNKTWWTPRMLTRACVFAFLALSLAISSCSDPVPLVSTKPAPYVIEAYLVVDSIPNPIRIARGQQLIDTFRISNGIVTDATVRVLDLTQPDTLRFEFRADSLGGAYYSSDNKRVRPFTRYKLEVFVAGTLLADAVTTSPGRIRWETAPRPLIQFPTDTLRQPSPDSLKISWQIQSLDGTWIRENREYLIRSFALDTLAYGRYLDPATDELNRRTFRPFEDEGSRFYLSRTIYGYLISASVNTVWGAFRWFGRHTITIMAPDPNFVNWFKLRFVGNQYDPLLNTFKTAAGQPREDVIGVFGSLSEATQEIFLLKNQP